MPSKNTVIIGDDTYQQTGDGNLSQKVVRKTMKRKNGAAKYTVTSGVIQHVYTDEGGINYSERQYRIINPNTGRK